MPYANGQPTASELAAQRKQADPNSAMYGAGVNNAGNTNIGTTVAPLYVPKGSAGEKNFNANKGIQYLDNPTGGAIDTRNIGTTGQVGDNADTQVNIGTANAPLMVNKNSAGYQNYQNNISSGKNATIQPVPGSAGSIFGDMTEAEKFQNQYYKNLNDQYNTPIDEAAIRKQKEADYQDPVWSVAQFTQGMAYGLGCIKNGDGLRFMKYNCIDTVGGTTSAGIDTLNLENETGAGVASIYSQYRPFVAGHNGNIYYGWAVYGGTDSVENVKTILCSSPAGTKIVYQSTTTRLAGDTTTFVLPIFGNEMGVIAGGFNSSLTGQTLYSYIYIQRDKIYGFYNATTLGITSIPGAAGWYSNSKDEIVVVRDNYIKQWRLPTLFDGFASSTVSSGGSLQIIPFITTSGLTASARYYLKDTYTNAGELSTIGTLPLGNALSSTVLKSDKY